MMQPTTETITALRKKYRDGIPVSCKRCGHEWIYCGNDERREELYRNRYPVITVCPRCRTSVRVRIPEYCEEEGSGGGPSSGE